MAELVCLLGSHIDSIDRLRRFELLLNSWNHSCHLWVSQSYSSLYLREASDTLLKRMAGPFLHIVTSDVCLSQFEHIVRLARELPSNQWIFFSDDDDMWHPVRYTILCQMKSHALKNHPWCNVIFTHGGTVTQSGSKCEEYVDYLLTQDKLMEIIEYYHPNLQDRMADCTFKVYFWHEWRTTVYFKVPEMLWLYRYTTSRRFRPGTFCDIICPDKQTGYKMMYDHYIGSKCSFLSATLT